MIDCKTTFRHRICKQTRIALRDALRPQRQKIGWLFVALSSGLNLKTAGFRFCWLPKGYFEAQHSGGLLLIFFSAGADDDEAAAEPVGADGSMAQNMPRMSANVGELGLRYFHSRNEGTYCDYHLFGKAGAGR